MKDDFMGCMFDLNGDGHTDAGEEFMAYQAFENANGENKPAFSGFGGPVGRLDGWTILIIAIVALAVLNTVCDWLY